MFQFLSFLTCFFSFLLQQNLSSSIPSFVQHPIDETMIMASLYEALTLPRPRDSVPILAFEVENKLGIFQEQSFYHYYSPKNAMCQLSSICLLVKEWFNDLLNKHFMGMYKYCLENSKQVPVVHVFTLGTCSAFLIFLAGGCAHFH